LAVRARFTVCAVFTICARFTITPVRTLALRDITRRKKGPLVVTAVLARLEMDCISVLGLRPLLVTQKEGSSLGLRCFDSARADAVKETIVVQDLKFVSTIRRVINKPSWRINTLVTEMGD
jgi:hypothetical protein